MEKSDNKQYLGYANGFLNFCHFFNRHFYVTLEETEITGSEEWTMKIQAILGTRHRTKTNKKQHRKLK